MTAFKSALSISAIVDDRRATPDGLSPDESQNVSEHRQLDRVLRSSPAALALPPADLAQRINARIDSVPHRRETVLAVLWRSPARMSALVAACVAFAAGTWLLLPVIRPTPERFGNAYPMARTLDLLDLPKRSDPALKQQLDDPYLLEAASLRSDTARAADMVLAHLPLGRQSGRP